jgi:hypothetical protein
VAELAVLVLAIILPLRLIVVLWDMLRGAAQL